MLVGADENTAGTNTLVFKDAPTGCNRLVLALIKRVMGVIILKLPRICPATMADKDDLECWYF